MGIQRLAHFDKMLICLDHLLSAYFETIWIFQHRHSRYTASCVTYITRRKLFAYLWMLLFPFRFKTVYHRRDIVEVAVHILQYLFVGHKLGWLCLTFENWVFTSICFFGEIFTAFFQCFSGDLKLIKHSTACDLVSLSYLLFSITAMKLPRLLIPIIK